LDEVAAEKQPDAADPLPAAGGMLNGALTLPFKLQFGTNSIFHLLPLALPVNAREASGAACAFLHES
jgi:hypothetical protein